MTVTSFTVQFLYSIGNESFSMQLVADVELHHFAAYYTAKNFRSAGRKKGPSLLPEQEIRRWESHWVHKDSNKETSLSLAIGKAIDHYENS